jgi:hypothetical protein
LEDYEVALIRHMNRLYNAGQLDALVELFTPLLPVYTDNGISLKATHSDTKASLINLRQTAQSRGVVHLKHNILSVETSPKGTSKTVFVEWHYLGADGLPVTRGEVKYYCGRDSYGIARVLMVEYVTPAFPEAYADMPVSTEVRTLN